MVFGSTSFRRIFPQIFKSVNTVKKSATNNVIPTRNLLTTSTGAILPEPKKQSFPFLRLLLVLTPAVYVGASIAKNGATILEENEIFVPSDDDEED